MELLAALTWSSSCRTFRIGIKKKKLTLKSSWTRDEGENFGRNVLNLTVKSHKLRCQVNNCTPVNFTPEEVLHLIKVADRTLLHLLMKKNYSLFIHYFSLIADWHLSYCFSSAPPAVYRIVHYWLASKQQQVQNEVEVEIGQGYF